MASDEEAPLGTLQAMAKMCLAVRGCVRSTRPASADGREEEANS